MTEEFSWQSINRKIREIMGPNTKSFVFHEGPKPSAEISRHEVEEATQKFLENGGKIEKIGTTYFDAVEIQDASHTDVWSPSIDPYEKESNG